MSVRTMRQHLDEAHRVLLGLRDAFSKQYWYCDPTTEGFDRCCQLCGHTGKEHIKSQNGYLCPTQPQEAKP